KYIPVGRRERDPLDIGGERPFRRRAPPPASGGATEQVEFGPARTPVVRYEQQSRLGSRVHHARLRRADRKRPDDPAAKPGWAPGRAAVVGAEHTLALRAGVDDAGMERIGGQTAHVLAGE